VSVGCSINGGHSDDEREHRIGLPCTGRHDHCGGRGGINHQEPQDGIKRSQLRLAQPGSVCLGIVEIEIEEMFLPALIHIQMRYDYIVHGDYLEVEKTFGGGRGDMLARPCLHDGREHRRANGYFRSLADAHKRPLPAKSGRSHATADGQKRTLACYRCRSKAADGLSDNSFIAMLELLAEG